MGNKINKIQITIYCLSKYFYKFIWIGLDYHEYPVDRLDTSFLRIRIGLKQFKRKKKKIRILWTKYYILKWDRFLDKGVILKLNDFYLILYIKYFITRFTLIKEI